MPAKWHKYSYTAQRAERRTIVAVLLTVVSLSIAFVLINRYLVGMYVVRTDAMEPTLSSGDCVATTSLYRQRPAPDRSLSPLIAPLRGDLVVLAPHYRERHGFFRSVTGTLISFLTFQKFDPFARDRSSGEKPVIRRLVAFPGDTIFMKDFILHVRPSNGAYFLTEFELAGAPYDIRVDRLPEGWSDALPLSGSFPETTLGDDEYYVLCDNRLAASDSRIWGPIPARRLRGKALLRYWPFRHFGVPDSPR